MKNIFKVFFIIVCILYSLFKMGKSDDMVNINDLKNIDSFNNNYLERYINYSKNNTKLSAYEVVKRVNINLDLEYYQDVKESLNKDTELVLVNKHYYLDKNYVPQDLEQVDYKYTSGIKIFARKNAKDKFEEMCSDASAIGLIIKAISAYRSYEYQDNLYKEYLINDPVEIVDTYSARPGHSEHQTGLSFDIYNVVSPYTDFGNTDEFKWIKNNAYKYGFIIRYTHENSYITGYKDEPWHIRYVGIKHATYIYENNITLEEYILDKDTFK